LWKTFYFRYKYYFFTGNVGQRAEGARLRAVDAEMKAIDAQNKINYILNQLPQDKDKIQQLATDTVKTNKDTNDAMEQSKSAILLRLTRIRMMLWSKVSLQYC
jgi:hypothetical protein